MVIFQVRLKDETDKKLKFITERQERSKNQQIEFIIKSFIQDYEKVNGPIKFESKEV